VTIVSGLGLPVTVIVTAGQEAEATQAESRIDGVPAQGVSADKGYASKAVVGQIEKRGAEAVIPSRRNSQEPRAYDRERYRDRNLAERFWRRVKGYRRVATRYEKTARNFPGFVLLASIMVLLR
jgi:transposase